MDYAHPEVLVETDWVAQNSPNEKRILVEVDYDPENGYRKGHIKGASLIWWKRDVNDPVTRDIVNKEQFEKLMSKNGITMDSEVILYGDFNNWFAAFVFWVFKYYGHKNIKIMNGGRKKWELEKREYTTEEPKITQTQYSAQKADEKIRAYLDNVRGSLGKSGIVMIDVRSLKSLQARLLHPLNIQWNMHKEADTYLAQKTFHGQLQ